MGEQQQGTSGITAEGLQAERARLLAEHVLALGAVVRNTDLGPLLAGAVKMAVEVLEGAGPARR